jgi:hypothetical protein
MYGVVLLFSRLQMLPSDHVVPKAESQPCEGFSRPMAYYSYYKSVM